MLIGGRILKKRNLVFPTVLKQQLIFTSFRGKFVEHPCGRRTVIGTLGTEVPSKFARNWNSVPRKDGERRHHRQGGGFGEG